MIIIIQTLTWTRFCPSFPPHLIFFFWPFFSRFLHKHPEDTSEVPNGFLTDINPVSDFD